MRLKVSLCTAAAMSFAGIAVLFANAPATAASACPGGWSQRTILTVPVTGTHVAPCLPYPQCDPGACDPTQLPPQS